MIDVWSLDVEFQPSHLGLIDVVVEKTAMGFIK